MHKPTIDSQAAHLIKVLSNSEVLADVLKMVPKLNLPNWYIAAGVVSQTYWNYVHGYKLEEHIKDIDLVYFDNNVTYEAEDSFIKKGKYLFKDIPIDVEIRNQARVHIWYPNHFGRNIKPYKSVEDGISSWGTTITCIGINNNNVYTPYGLDDLFNLVVKPNKIQILQKNTAKKHRDGKTLGQC